MQRDLSGSNVPAAVKRNFDGVSVVVPVYNEEECLERLHSEIRAALAGIPHEILYVNDGSTDGSREILDRIAAGDRTARVVHFRRNFGKSAALAAGFARARYEAVATLDADLQDDPGEIPRLLGVLVEEDLDLVSGWKKSRKDPLEKRLPSRLFNKTTQLLTGVRLHDFNCGLKVYRREVVQEVTLYGELHRYIPALAHYRGFRVGEAAVNHRPRGGGHSKFGLERYVRGMFDLMSIVFLGLYQRRPLHLFGGIGLVFAALGVIINAYLTVLWFMGEGIGDRPLLILGVLLIIVGVQSVSFGLIAELIARTSHTSDEPPYSIAREVRAELLPPEDPDSNGR
ncbi:glycosyltransferase [Rubrobacter taiwanensis]|jgi:glycosyltransferase involved in cell wall biosynthesis|uniref:Glycosyltransferase n=1 Tax=Rubrobacter taiwanensis TaxID=185139 RepID=A0A4R1BEZ4_9ACTN|nr:glycosyltransferase family 2 protein [Rubrobacter taiwanensis]TCJ15667.1 glycosyltransferase [Rubrobacter taiwanensis]